MSQDNAGVVRKLVDAYNAGDREGWCSLVDPDVSWRPLVGPLLGSDTLAGRDEAARVFFEVAPDAFEGYHAVPEDIRELDDDKLLLVARYEGKARLTEMPMSIRVSSLYRLRDGKVVSVSDFQTEDEALEAAAGS